jgi:GNAT superfamily N-acetyltransferase
MGCSSAARSSFFLAVLLQERDWASMLRSMTSQLSQHIQDSHQQMITLTHNVREVAEKMAPNANTRRVKMEAQSTHALRMAEASLEMDVVRADLRHLPLLLPLFEQYRAFHAQSADPEKLEEFLRDKLSQQSTVIFVALPVPNAAAHAHASQTGADKGAPGSLPMRGGESHITPAEQAHASALVSSHSNQQGGSAATAHSSGGPSRVGTRGGVMPAYALGFVQLIPTYSTLHLSRTWLLADLFTSQSSRNKGVASLLLTHVKRFAADSGAAAIEIHTAVPNNHMQRMFARQEFNKQLDTATYAHSLTQ